MKNQKAIILISLILLILGLGFFGLAIKKQAQKTAPKVYYLNNNETSTQPTLPEIAEKPNLFALAKKVAGFEKEMNYLLLFQNSLELRPTGGFISSFGILKVKDAKTQDFQFYDTAVFDIYLSSPTQVEPPSPIHDYLFVKNWQFRDGNWSPDFPTTAQKMIEFYQTQGGKETFDGVIGITPEVLKSLLKIHGAIELKDYNLTIDQDNFLLALEKQVEMDYWAQDIPRKDRKNILRDLAKILLEKTLALNPLRSLSLIGTMQDLLNQKDVLLYFNDSQLEKDIETLGWSGVIKQADSDYLMVVDANVNAFKADLYVERSLKYEVDLASIPKKARLTIHYFHTATQKSWLTRNYQSWLRIYVPENSWFTNINGIATQPEYAKEFGKTVVAGLVKVPIASNQDVILEYDLPENVSADNYKFFIQKQPGIKELPVEIIVNYPDGTQKTIQQTITTDKIMP